MRQESDERPDEDGDGKAEVFPELRGVTEARRSPPAPLSRLGFVSIVLGLFVLPLSTICCWMLDDWSAAWSRFNAPLHQPRRLTVEPPPPTKWAGRHWNDLTAEERREVLAPVRERLEEVRQARRETVERAEQLARGGDTQEAVDRLEISARLYQLLRDEGSASLSKRRPLLPHDLRGIPSDDELAGGPLLLQLGRAAILYRAGRYAEAEQDAREVEDAASGAIGPVYDLASKALLLRLLAVAAQGRLEEAEQSARSAVERWPDGPSPRIALSVLLESGGKVGAAERQVREAERRVPIENRTMRAGLLAELCRMNLRLGNVEEAERFGRAAVEADPDSLPARLNLAAVLLGTGRTGEAEAEMVAAADAHPEDAQPIANLSGVRLEQGEPRAAEALARTAVRLAPWSPQASLALAQSLYFQDRQEDAVQELRRTLDESLDASPADATLRMLVARRIAYLALVLAELGSGPVYEDRERVAALAAEAAEFPPADHVRDVWLAEAFELTGEYGAAERVARRATAAAPDRPEPWRQLGRALLGLKDYSGGAEAFGGCWGTSPTTRRRASSGPSPIWTRAVKSRRWRISGRFWPARRAGSAGTTGGRRPSNWRSCCWTAARWNRLGPTIPWSC